MKLNVYVIKHREIGFPDSYISSCRIEAETQGSAELIFAESHEDLPYFIVSVEKIEPHYFKAGEDADNKFCATCSLYLTDDMHIRWEAK